MRLLLEQNLFKYYISSAPDLSKSLFFPITFHSSAILGLSKILFCQNNGNTEMLNKCPRDNDPTKQKNTKPHLYT